MRYFGARGAYCPPDSNVAEFLLDAGVGNVRAKGHRVDWSKVWEESQEFADVKTEIIRLVADRGTLAKARVAKGGLEFAASTAEQTIVLTKRMWLNYWRSPAYAYGNLFTVLSTAIIAGFTFWKLADTETALQERLFAAFIFIFLPAPILNATIPKVPGADTMLM